MASYQPTPTDEPPRAERSVTLQDPRYDNTHEAVEDPDAEVALPMMHHEGDPHSQTEANGNPQVQVPGMEVQPAPTGPLAWAGFGCSIFGLMCLCIGFASPYWWATWPNSFNTFLNIGLWEVCFRNYMHHKDDSQEIYDGCWWVFSADARYHKLREWLLPRKYSQHILLFYLNTRKSDIRSDGLLRLWTIKRRPVVYGGRQHGGTHLNMQVF